MRVIYVNTKKGRVRLSDYIRKKVKNTDTYENYYQRVYRRISRSRVKIEKTSQIIIIDEKDKILFPSKR